MKVLLKHCVRIIAPLFGLSALALLVCGVPPARADAPPCRYTPSQNTVLDNETMLSWQRTVDANHSWEDAKSYCLTLSLDGGGWRLPTIQELQTLVDESKISPSIDETAFPSTPSAHFWSSSASAGFAGYAWYVDFAGGDVSLSMSDASNDLAVRCVR